MSLPSAGSVLPSAGSVLPSAGSVLPSAGSVRRAGGMPPAGPRGPAAVFGDAVVPMAKIERKYA
jgi:hypothetical protein